MNEREACTQCLFWVTAGHDSMDGTSAGKQVELLKF